MRNLGLPTSPSPLAFGELFAGAGGMALGLKQAGLKPSWAVDYSVDACNTYDAMIAPHAVCSKVEDVDFQEMPDVNGLAFGFPCNDFSMVGERKGQDGYFGGLFHHAVRALNDIEPIWFIAENVPGLMTKGGSEIMQAFADAGPGYNVTVHLYKFDEYGVPQKRHRVIGVGIRKDLNLTFMPPAPTHEHPIGAKKALAGIVANAVHHEMPKHSKKVAQMLAAIPPGKNCWCDEVPEELRLKTEVRMSLIYRRLHPDEPSYTVVASGGGGTHGYHYAEPRALTNRERARLQTFPDDFNFCGDIASVRKQIGMAVPPRGAFCIGDALIKTLKGIPYDWVEASIGVLQSK